MLIAGMPMEFKSASDAVDIGYKKGRGLHDQGAKPESLSESIETYRGNYTRSPHYKLWISGFTAGFLGVAKPPVPHE